MIRIQPILDPTFEPFIAFLELFELEVKQSQNPIPFSLAILNHQHCVSRTDGFLFTNQKERNFVYIERLIKTALWLKGGVKVLFAGPEDLAKKLADYYQNHPLGQFDHAFMEKLFERDFEFQCVPISQIPTEMRQQIKIGGHLDGARIGFDAGGSDRKVAALLDGQVLYSEEVIWHPKLQSDPEYHIQHIKEAFQTAASHLPRIDAIGVSAAGVYIDNQVMAASLFIKVEEPLFQTKVKPLFLNLAKAMGDVPIVVANDGDVSALAGAMECKRNNLLGLAFGTSEAAGYIDPDGYITGWLNELAFVPVAINRDAPVDEWSQDRGCGSSYFSQDAVIRLAPKAGIEFEPTLSPAQKLKVVQSYLEKAHPGAIQIYQTIGVYLAYGLLLYRRFYHMDVVMLLGRVVSGQGGDIVIQTAKDTLAQIDPLFYQSLTIYLPNEEKRRVGQAIAAASLPTRK